MVAGTIGMLVSGVASHAPDSPQSASRSPTSSACDTPTSGGATTAPTTASTIPDSRVDEAEGSVRKNLLPDLQAEAARVGLEKTQEAAPEVNSKLVAELVEKGYQPNSKLPATHECSNQAFVAKLTQVVTAPVDGEPNEVHICFRLSVGPGTKPSDPGLTAASFQFWPLSPAGDGILETLEDFRFVHSRIETCGSPSDHSAPTADIESQSEDGKRQEISLSAKEPHSQGGGEFQCEREGKKNLSTHWTQESGDKAATKNAGWRNGNITVTITAAGGHNHLPPRDYDLVLALIVPESFGGKIVIELKHMHCAAARGGAWKGESDEGLWSKAKTRMLGDKRCYFLVDTRTDMATGESPSNSMMLRRPGPSGYGG